MFFVKNFTFNIYMYSILKILCKGYLTLSVTNLIMSFGTTFTLNNMLAFRKERLE